MTLLSTKDLVKLANACRKAGIKTFKSEGIEFTLTDEIPEKVIKGKKGLEAAESSQPTNEELPYESLLHWSVMGLDEEKSENES